MISCSIPCRRWLAGVFFLALATLSGCATQTRSLLAERTGNLPAKAELTSTPFFAQDRYQCGPATLAMSLRAIGIDTTPEALRSQVFLPQREGSLQLEMLATARRNGALAMTVPPRLDVLLSEVAHGNPVIVLQNLSLPWIPMWHYALVIGYDLDREEMILRSGTTERLVMAMSTFEHTWARSTYWAMVATPPGRLPVSAEEATAVPALVAFEKGNDPQRARQNYAAALQRWPHNITLQLGLGNTAFAAGDHNAAAAAFQMASEEHPDSAPALNNLAEALAGLGKFEQAHQAASKALSLGGPWRDIASSTLQAIEVARRNGHAQ